MLRFPLRHVALLIACAAVPLAARAEESVPALARKVFDANLADWKRNTLPSLARSNVRFFFTDGKTITEVAF